MEIRTEIEIAAPAETVWGEFIRFEAWPAWNPFMPRIEGKAAPGEQLTVRIEPPGGRAMTFRPKVLTVEHAKEFRWKGKLLLPGIFDGMHCFELHALDARLTHFVQREEFTGLLVPLMAGELNRSTRNGFVLMNEALKQRAESAAANRTSS